MARFIASTLFKENNDLHDVVSYLIKYNAVDEPTEDAFERVKRYIEERDDVRYYAGRPYPCYLDPRYSDAFDSIQDDYSFLFRDDGKPHNKSNSNTIKPTKQWGENKHVERRRH